MGPYAKVIADSINPKGDRLTTLEIKLHRYMLPEFNTHRKKSRNSASSRAIPVEKIFASVENDPAFPFDYLSEQPGMQAGVPLEGEFRRDAVNLVKDLHALVLDRVQLYLQEHPDKSTRLHKSTINRYLEPFMWHTVIASATQDGWNNFFEQRCSPLAQDEIRIPAEMARAAMQESVPLDLDYEEWHLPYIEEEDYDQYDIHDLVKISSARCARVSYLTHDGVRDCKKDLNLHTKLYTADPPHFSPFEHQATPSEDMSTEANFKGWTQYRFIAEQEIKEANNYYGQEW